MSGVELLGACPPNCLVATMKMRFLLRVASSAVTVVSLAALVACKDTPAPAAPTATVFAGGSRGIPASLDVGSTATLTARATYSDGSSSRLHERRDLVIVGHGNCRPSPAPACSRRWRKATRRFGDVRGNHRRRQRARHTRAGGRVSRCRWDSIRAVLSGRHVAPDGNRHLVGRDAAPTARAPRRGLRRLLGRVGLGSTGTLLAVAPGDGGSRQLRRRERRRQGHGLGPPATARSTTVHKL